MASFNYSRYHRIIAYYARMKCVATDNNFDDLMQAGYIGLIKANEKLISTNAMRNEAYRMLRIKYEIIDEIRRIVGFSRSYFSDKKYLETEFFPVEEQHWSYDPTNSYHRAIDGRRVLRLIDNLIATSKRRNVLRDIVYSEKTLAVIARENGITLSRCSQIRSELIKKIQSKLSKEKRNVYDVRSHAYGESLQDEKNQL